MRTLLECREELEDQVIDGKVDLKIVEIVIQRFVAKGWNGLRIANLFNEDEGSVTVESLEDFEVAGIFYEMYELTNKLNIWNYQGIPNTAIETYLKGKLSTKDETILEFSGVVDRGDGSYLCPIWVTKLLQQI